MKRSLLVIAGLLMIGSGSAGGQQVSDQCPTGGAGTVDRFTQDICQKSIDLFNYMAPQLGTIIAGGNTTLGQGGTMGGIGNFSVGLRVNALFGTLPQVDQVALSSGGAQQSTYPTKGQILPGPALDASIGIFKGIPALVSSVGGVDLLLSAAYLPEYSGDNFEIRTPEGSLEVGYGARVGILQESLVSPGISVSIMQRNLPQVDLTATTPADDSIRVTGLDVKTTAWRLTASKSFILFGLAAGVGQDHYKSSAIVNGSVVTPIGRRQSRDVNLEQSLRRTNYFLDAYMNILLVKIVAEVGMVQGGTVETYNQFEDKKADAPRTYLSIGARVGL